MSLISFLSNSDAPSTTNLPQPDDEHFSPEYFDPIQEKYKLVEKVGEGNKKKKKLFDG